MYYSWRLYYFRIEISVTVLYYFSLPYKIWRDENKWRTELVSKKNKRCLYKISPNVQLWKQPISLLCHIFIIASFFVSPYSLLNDYCSCSEPLPPNHSIITGLYTGKLCKEVIMTCSKVAYITDFAWRDWWRSQNISRGIFFLLNLNWIVRLHNPLVAFR
jgi:hypothetical protein